MLRAGPANPHFNKAWLMTKLQNLKKVHSIPSLLDGFLGGW